jgi:hypothetical protein
MSKYKLIESLDDELAAIKARVEKLQSAYEALPVVIRWEHHELEKAYDKAHNEWLPHAPTDISRLLKALELCRRQRDFFIKCAMDEDTDRHNEHVNADAALLEILRGSE